MPTIIVLVSVFLTASGTAFISFREGDIKIAFWSLTAVFSSAALLGVIISNRAAKEEEY